jgi:predicted kinase
MNSQTAVLKGPTIHLICGSVGAGKSTYAKHLKAQTNAVYFAIDDWMMALFGPDVKTPMDWSWINERALRCEKQIISLAIELAQTSTSSILEIGLQSKKKRTEVISVLESAACVFQTHYLAVEAAERWSRVQMRNAEKGETYRLTITKDLFDFFEHMWEPPTLDESASLNLVEPNTK